MPKLWTPEERAKASQQAKERAAARKAQAQQAADEEILQQPIGDPPDDEAEFEQIEGPAPEGDDEEGLRAARRKRLLGDLSPEDAALVSDDELEKIEREERDKAIAEQKKQVLGEIRAIARTRAQVEHDLIPADRLRSAEEKARLARPVKIRFALPNNGSGHRGRNGIRIDGRLYDAGRWHTVPTAVMESIRSNAYQAWVNEIQFRSLEQLEPGWEHGAKAIVARNIPQFEVADA